jgi:hypothetical protein
VWIVDPDRSNRPAFNSRWPPTASIAREERLDARATRADAAYKGRLLVYRRKLAGH